MKLNIAITLFICLFVFNCQNESRKPSDINLSNNIKEVATLVTQEVVLKKIVFGHHNRDLDLGIFDFKLKLKEAHFLIELTAQVGIGVDLTRFGQKNFRTNKDTLEIFLPEPEIVNVSIPIEKATLIAELSDNKRFTMDDLEGYLERAQTELIKNLPFIDVKSDIKSQLDSIFNRIYSDDYKEIQVLFLTK